MTENQLEVVFWAAIVAILAALAWNWHPFEVGVIAGSISALAAVSTVVRGIIDLRRGVDR